MGTWRSAKTPGRIARADSDSCGLAMSPYTTLRVLAQTGRRTRTQGIVPPEAPVAQDDQDEERRHVRKSSYQIVRRVRLLLQHDLKGIETREEDAREDGPSRAPARHDPRRQRDEPAPAAHTRLKLVLVERQ